MLSDSDSNSCLSNMEDKLLEEFKMEGILDPYTDYKSIHDNYKKIHLVPTNIDTSTTIKVIGMLEKFVKMVPELNDSKAENQLMELLNANLK